MSTVNVNRVVDASGGVLAPISSVHRNRIINGSFTIDQRNAGASVTVNATGSFFPVDRFFGYGQSTDGVFTLQRNTTVPAGFINSLIATITTADASIGATQEYGLNHNIEGFNVADLGWGTADAKSITISFWTRSSVTGTHSGSLSNNAYNRAYVFSYTISAANTWEYKTITIAGDTSGTWLKDNGVGIRVRWNLGSGSTWLGTAGAWGGTFFNGATGSVQLISTLSATFYITGVQLEVGTQATSFEYRQYQQELALCQRYAYKISGSNAFSPLTGAGQGTTATTIAFTVPAKVSMRATPSLLTTGNLCITANGLNSLTAVTGMDIYRAIPENPMVQATVASGITAGVCYFLHGNNDTTASLLISAEL